VREDNISCKKCKHEPREWDKLSEDNYADYSCPKCGKEHLHIKNQLKNSMIPVDEEEKEIQNVFITTTGRKIHGVARVKSYLRQISNQKFCKNCGERKSDGWLYNSGNNCDIQCPECRQKYLVEKGKLIPIDDRGNRLTVLNSSKGTFVGDAGESLEELKSRIITGERGAETDEA
jgi:Zn finger protein HypA/HybF involved in hydrogenase expression